MPSRRFWIWFSMPQKMALIFDHILPVPLAEQAAQNSVWRSRLEVHPGNHFAIIASSGRGKSTLVNIAYGIRHDYSGSYKIDGRAASGLSAIDWSLLRQSTFACVFQDLKLFPQLSALDNLKLKCDLGSSFSIQQATAMAERLGLAPYLDKPCGQLSMGQQQRLAVVRALCQPFQYLFLDEPTSHLDRANADLVIELVMEQAAAQHAAVMITGLDQDHRLPHSFQLLSV
ncbi:MAG: hypothetical protein RLZZ370_1221 [Bacteroidota bacterium]|jgi:putative ABC transport system ATP-binding protein